MRMLYGLEFLHLVKELELINGYFVDNFYELDKGKFRLKLSKSGNQINLLCVLPYSISNATVFEHKNEATNFAIAVRKRIKGFKIVKVSRVNNDRIIEIKLEKNKEEIGILFELFGKGNMVIVNNDNTIMLAYVQHEFKDRSTRINAKYVPPRSNTAINLLDYSSVLKGLQEAVSEGNIRLEDALQKKLQIGKPYISQIILELGIDTADIKQFSEEMQKKFYYYLMKYINATDFYLYMANNYSVDFSIGLLKQYESYEKQKFDTLEETIAAFYAHEPEHKKENPIETELIKSIEKQKKLVEEIENEINESKKAAEYIFSNMTEINKLISNAQSNKHITLDEIQRYTSIKIKEIDLKNKTITIIIE
ncbi:MAG: NFACT family protein [Candidatus Micrarchaeia archaeon]